MIFYMSDTDQIDRKRCLYSITIMALGRQLFLLALVVVLSHDKNFLSLSTIAQYVIPNCPPMRLFSVMLLATSYQSSRRAKSREHGGGWNEKNVTVFYTED